MIKILIIGCMLYFPLEAMLPKPVKSLILQRLNPCVTVSVDEQDEQGRTCLHLAVLQDNANDIKVLLSRGALLTTKDNSGLTAVDYARNNDKLISVRNLFVSLDLIKTVRENSL